MELQATSTKSAMPHSQKLSKQRKPSKQPKNSKTNRTLEERRAKKALKNFEVLKSSARPVAPVAPMAQEGIPPESPITAEAQNTLGSPIQRTEDASILSEPVANAKAQTMSIASGIPSAPTNPSKPGSQQTYQLLDIFEDEATYTDDINDQESQLLFIEANNAFEQEDQETLPATLTADAQRNNTEEDPVSNEAQALDNDYESVQSEYEVDDLPDGV